MNQNLGITVGYRISRKHKNIYIYVQYN
jgi:hypothetical protein